MPEPTSILPDPSVFYRNTGNDPNFFIDASDEVGFNDMLWGCALLAFDSNRDGWQDLAQLTLGYTHPEEHAIRLLENRDNGPIASTHNYLVVRPRMCGVNRRAIGATVEVTAGTLTMTRLISAGTSQMGQEPAEAHFGLGPAIVADRVVINWPSGAGSTVLTHVAANQIHTVIRETPSDFDQNSKTQLKDFATMSAEWMQTGSELICDLNGDDFVDEGDFQRFVPFWLQICP